MLSVSLLATTGCATLRATFGGYATGADGQSRSQQRLRAAFVAGDFKAALAWRDDDALLQALTTGIASYYANQFARSAAVLDGAALLADDRITASLSKDALSLVTNDMARPYQPRRTERLFIPYYGMLSYVQLGAWEDAAVEARRLVALLAQYGEEREEGERALHGAMQHLAGAVFERAGERNEAQVAYRASRALYSALPDSVPRHADTGELLVVVERGFVAHRTTQTIELFLDAEERDSVKQGGEERRRAIARIVERTGTGDGAAMSSDPRPSGQVVVASTSSVFRHWEPLSYRGRRRRHGDDGYYLTIAYPVLRRSAPPWGGSPRLVADDVPLAGMQVTATLDDASAVDASRERVGLATRAVARAVAKYAVTKAIKDRKGEVAGSVANVGASFLERADVRSWHLLPQELSLVRVRLPAGARTLRVVVGEGSSARTVDVGPVVIRAGTLTIAPVRLWRDPPPAPDPTPPPPVFADADSMCTMFFCP
jgi:hypothetical protein